MADIAEEQRKCHERISLMKASSAGHRLEAVCGVSARLSLGRSGRTSERAWSYLVRVKVPLDAKLMPHKHPEDRIYTVMSGVFYIGLGETFDGDKVNAYPPGSAIVLPGETWHFHWAKSGEYVTQVSAIGPLGLEYHDLHNDPRMQQAVAFGSAQSANPNTRP
ncbi:cupin domain-containing protein [Bradyrhizobium sp. Pha-3]|uniref:cupin domain-containing protein n=1 Tax=Bradyrhizobium sp. Pha-3 TaxID=208375 RepID=UPI0035D4CDCD